MLLGGDELGRTQSGNNNAYCQDNEISWYDWENVDEDLLSWAQSVLRLRSNHPVFRRRRFFQGRPLRQNIAPAQETEIGWFRPDGMPMNDDDWGVGYAKALGVLLNGAARPERDRHGRLVADTSFYLALNAWERPLEFRMPGEEWGGPWRVVVDTCDDRPKYRAALLGAGDGLHLTGHHFVVLQQSDGTDRRRIVT
jgi:isoamylase